MNTFTQLATYYDDYSYGSSQIDNLSLGFVILLYISVLVFGLAIYALYSFILGRIFAKAGVKQWIAWVPFYNTWKMLELGGQPGFWAVLAIFPIINIVSTVYIYIAMYHIGLKLGKEGWWVVLAIFVPIVWFAILAFDSSKWQVKQTV